MLQTINICITVNVLIIAVILFFKNTGNVKANRLLSIILLSNVIINIWNVLMKSKIYQYIAYWEYIAAFAAGPTIYLYIREITGRKTSLDRNTLLQYIFMPLAFIFYLIYLVKSPVEKQIFLQEVNSKQRWEYDFLDLLFYAQFSFYLIYGLVFVYKNRTAQREFYSSLEKVKLDWLIAFLWTLLAMDLIAIPIATSIGSPAMVQFVPILSSLIYLTLVYNAFTQPFVFSEYADFREMKTVNLPVKFEVVSAKPDVPEDLIQKINQYMVGEKPFLNKDLTIKSLAESIQIPSHQLSQIINQNYKKNFFDFINAYRVEEAKAQLLNSEFDHLKIESLGEAAGFNSRASFFSTFKKHTQLTPTEFRKQAKQEVFTEYK